MSRFRFFILVAIACVGYPWWRFLISCRAKLSRKSERFLVIPQNNRLGDLVCATPVFRAIKERYPKSHLAVLISRAKGSWEIIKNNPRVDEIIFYESPKLLRTLRRGNFSYSFNLTTYPVPNVLAFLGLIPNRVKTVVKERSLSEFLTDCLNTKQYLYKHHTSAPRHYLRLIEEIGIHDSEPMAEVFSGEAGNIKAAEFFKKHHLQKSDFIVGLSITAGNKIKEWGDDRFAELIRRLATEYRAKIILLGGPNDGQRLSKLRDGLNLSENVFIADGFRIEALPSLMSLLKLYIAVDTGPIYVAQALRIPFVDIMGPCDAREQPGIDALGICVNPEGIAPSSFVFKRPGPVSERLRAVRAITEGQAFAAVKGLIERLNLAGTNR